MPFFWKYRQKQEKSKQIQDKCLYFYFEQGIIKKKIYPDHWEKRRETMKKEISKKVKTGLLCGALVGVMGIGGILAYFTDGDTATNTMTVGQISIDLQEPNWEPKDDITPGQDIRKDPLIKNDGENDAYVFLEVSVPYANITTAKVMFSQVWI